MAEPKNTTSVEATGKKHEPRNFLVTFLLASTFGAIGLRHFYLGDKQIGWLRVGLFAGGYLWMILLTMMGQATLASIGVFAVMAAGLWALVDFFYVYFSVRKDAEGQSLVATARDKQWAKVLFWVTIGIVVAAIVGGVAVASFVENSFKQNYHWRYDSDNLLEDRPNRTDYPSLYN